MISDSEDKHKFIRLYRQTIFREYVGAACRGTYSCLRGIKMDCDHAVLDKILDMGGSLNILV